MAFLAVVNNGEIIVASLTYIVCASLIVATGYRYRHAITDATQTDWSSRLKLNALSRFLIIAGYIYFTYPTLFGLNDAPTLVYLAYGGDVNVSSPFQLLFVAAFAVTIFSPMARRAELAQPIRACLLVGYIFLALTSYLGVTVASVWPGLDVFLLLFVVAYAAQQIAFTAARSHRLIVRHVDERLIVDMVGLISQIPIVLIYGYGLGRQIAIV